MRRLVPLIFAETPEKIWKFFPEICLEFLAVDGIFQSSVSGFFFFEITVNNLCGSRTVAADLNIPDKKRKQEQKGRPANETGRKGLLWRSGKAEGRPTLL